MCFRLTAVSLEGINCPLTLYSDYGSGSLIGWVVGIGRILGRLESFGSISVGRGLISQTHSHNLTQMCEARLDGMLEASSRQKSANRTRGMGGWGFGESAGEGEKRQTPIMSSPTPIRAHRGGSWIRATGFTEYKCVQLAALSAKDLTQG